MKITGIFLVFFFWLVLPIQAEGGELIHLKRITIQGKTLFVLEKLLKNNSTLENNILEHRPSPLLAKFRKKQKSNKRLTASLLAFPFPFGIVGLHRIYLGCAPYIPVVYIGTLGGVFGVLPLIDFFVLAFDSDTENYSNNDKVFMWVK